MNTSLIPVICFGEASGEIDVIVSGGIAPYAYSWSNNASTSNLKGLTAGTYSLTVTDANNCSISADLVITEAPVLTASVTKDLIVDCENGMITETISANVAGGVRPYLYSWMEQSFQSNSQVVVNRSGSYELIVRDANGCETAVNFSSDIPFFGESDKEIFGTIDPFGNYTLNTPVQLSLLKSDNIVSWSWDLGDGTVSSNENFEHIYSDVGQYTIRLQTTDANGCTQEKSETITVNLGYEIVMPTAFTPNGDGLNDTLYPEHYGLTDIKLIIYSKWGEAIFVSEKIETGGWTGLVNNVEAPVGAYAYKLIASSLSGKSIEKSGSFMLVKK
jgi:gliding motility-associated-like protein